MVTGMIDTSESARAGRLELILQQIESLPTLPVVATRVLNLTASDQSNAKQITDLIRTDPALTAKVLSLCRGVEPGVRADVMTVDRAVVLLGFNAIRNAVLSMKVFDAFDAGEDGEGKSSTSAAKFDREGFWRHSLAVAIAAELLAIANPEKGDLSPADAFVCGLLHDIGKLALDMILPKSFSRVIELAELNQGNIAEFERRVIGIDHHTAGKRLAEQWQLPHRLQDCIWLHGSPYESLPPLEHKRMVGLISLADLIVRQHHLGYSGNFHVNESVHALTQKLQLTPGSVSEVEARLFEEVEIRGTHLGLSQKASRQLFHESIRRANEELGRLNRALERRSRAAQRQAELLDAVTAFNASATPGRSVQDTLNAVVASAIAALGGGFYAIVQQPRRIGAKPGWLVCQYNGQAQPSRSALIDPPPHCPDLTTLDPAGPASMNLMGLMPWIADYLVDAPDLREVRLLPLSCGWGTAALLLHDRPTMPAWQQLNALTSTWGAAVAAAGQHEGARRMGEQLADANRALSEVHDKLLHSEAMARLGEMAAGAAHEMNNPLAVIAGRAELLVRTLPEKTKQHVAASTIVDQAHRLSDLITLLRLFSDPPKPAREVTDVQRLLDEAVADAKAALSDPRNAPPVRVVMAAGALSASMDPRQIRQAVTDLVRNAMEASPRTGVTVTAAINDEEHSLRIEVADDGIGLDAHAMAHAMDPFFSAKPAGRQVGMGLPRARQLVSGHGGTIGLRGANGGGTVASLSIPLDLALGVADR